MSMRIYFIDEYYSNIYKEKYLDILKYLIKEIDKDFYSLSGYKISIYQNIISKLIFIIKENSKYNMTDFIRDTKYYLYRKFPIIFDIVEILDNINCKFFNDFVEAYLNMDEDKVKLLTEEAKKSCYEVRYSSYRGDLMV